MILDKGFKQELSKHRADILIATHPWSSPCFKIKNGQVFIYDAHNCEYILIKEILKGRWYKGLISFFVKLIERSACRKAAIIIVSSKKDRELFVKLYRIAEEKIFIIPNGACIEAPLSYEKRKEVRRKLNISDAKSVLLFIGTYYKPNIEAVKFIINEVAPKLPESNIVLLGTVSEYFKNKHVPKNVRLLGRISDAELYDWLTAVDMGINPMFSGSGINMKMLDYFSFGLPVVTTWVGARGIDGVNSKDFIVCKESEFVDKIKLLLNNDDLRKDLGKNARKLAEEIYDWKKISGELSCMLSGMIKTGEVINREKLYTLPEKSMNKPNILYITLYLPLKNIHGGGNRMFEQIKCLSDKYNICLISFLRDWEEEGVGLLKPYCREINTVSIKEKKSRSYSFTKPGFVKNYYSPEMNALIRKKISAANFDIVQFEYLPMAQYRDGLKIKAKSVLIEHQLGFLCLKKEAGIESDFLRRAVLLFRYNRLKTYEMKIFKKFDKVVFVSSYESARAGMPHSFVSPMGVDTEYFKPGKINEENIDLIYTGNFDNFQNEDAMIYFSGHIWPLIKKKRPQTNIKIIGVNSRERLGFLKEQDGIDVLGRVEDIREYLSRAKVFIMPARIGGGMRGKLLEALSMGKPVVSTSIGVEGYEEGILKAVKIADNPQDFADKTLETLCNKAMRQNLGVIARLEIEKRYRWERIFSDMDIFYKSLLLS